MRRGIEIGLDGNAMARLEQTQKALNQVVELLDRATEQNAQIAEDIRRCKKYLLENARALQQVASSTSLHVLGEDDDGGA